MEPRIQGYLTTNTRALRKRMPPAEVALWEQLRGRGEGRFRFRRQMPLHGYIVDFCCARARVVVEVDGDSHAETVAADSERYRVLRSHGYVVLRFSNLDVLESLDGVVEQILAACGGGRNPPLAPP